jgi:hypothetical protein
LLWRGASDERQPFRCETSRRSRRSDSRACLWRRAAPLPARSPRGARAAPADLIAIGEPEVDEPADTEADELLAPEDVDAGDDALCPAAPAIPRAAGRFGCDPDPIEGIRVGEVELGTDGLGTVGVWIAGGLGGVTVTGGGLGGVTVTGGGLGTVTVTGGGFGTVTVTGGGFGTVIVGTVTVGVGTEVTVGTVSAGLA